MPRCAAREFYSVGGELVQIRKAGKVVEDKERRQKATARKRGSGGGKDGEM